MGGPGSLLLAGLPAIAGVAMLRAAWARKVRSAALNAAGWSLLALAAMLAWQAAGAWGTALASLAAMGTAMALLATAALRSAPGIAAAASNRRAGMLPQGREPLHLGRRLLTFAIVALLAPAAALALAIALRTAALALGAAEADANALALFAMPLGWAILAGWLPMMRARRPQFLILGLTALPLLPALALGGAQ